MLTRRMVVGGLMGAPLLTSLSTEAFAQAQYPNRPVTIIVPFAAGGPADISGRIIAQALGDRLKGGSFIVENRSGASGTIGLGALAKSKPDGYTLAIGAGGALTMIPHLISRLPYNAQSDFQPITVLMIVPLMLAVRKTLPVKNVKELVELARKQPGKLTFGSSGIGTSQHLTTELFKLRVGGIDIVHVPYRGVAPALTDLMGGQIDIMFGDASAMLAQIQSGDIKALAVAAKERLMVLPDVPTLRESGVSDAEAESFYGLLGPAGLPKELVTTIRNALLESIKDPAVKQQIVSQGGFAVVNTPEDFSSYILAETKKWGEVIRLAGVTMNQ